MTLLAECPDCGKKYKFANADAGQIAHCKECGASFGVSRKSAQFAKPKKQAKKKRFVEPDQSARLTEAEKKDAVRAGRSGAKKMLAALLASFTAFVLMLASYYTSTEANPGGSIPRWIPPVLMVASSVLLILATLNWRGVAERIERGLVVKVCLILGPTLLVFQLVRFAGIGVDFLDWLATYGTITYFTLLVAFLERITVLADRPDLQDVANRVLSCGVGVIMVGQVRQFVVLLGAWPLAVVVAGCSVLLIILWIIWTFEYTRLLFWLMDA